MGLTVSLDGEWAFAYQPDDKGRDRDQTTMVRRGGQTDKPSEIPDAAAFETSMPVPAYWDDHLDRVRILSNWRKASFNPNAHPIAFPSGAALPDASLPYLIGTGWYRKRFIAPPEWDGRTVTLHVGGVALEAWVWLNGQFVGYHLGHSTPFEMSLEKHLKSGQENELLIAVANMRTGGGGCSIRGYSGCSAGITRPVCLKVGGKLRIRSLYLYPRRDNQELVWNLELSGCGDEVPDKSWRAEWSVREPLSGKPLAEGIAAGEGGQAQWTTGTFNMRTWSDRSPILYEVEVRVKQGDAVQDQCAQPFGLRRLERDGILLRLNGTPIYMRGVCDHHYFPFTCTAPICAETYRSNLRRLKSLGFNWLRFHTWVPNEEYMQAADELGFLIQVEPPCGFGEGEWLDILRTCRRHPSVVLYCGGNEELLDEAMIEFLRQMQALQRKHVPDALFSPMEALRGVEYGWSPTNVEPDAGPGPDSFSPEQRVNSRRHALLGDFSDVFESLPCNMEYGWPQTRLAWLNRASSWKGDWKGLGGLWRWLKDDHPHLIHELCILGTYLDLDLEHRYEGTRIGTALYAAARKHLREEGVLDRASLYYRNSGAVTALWRKYYVEMARRCAQAQGYDLLGGSDHHWHRTGYPCGVLNDFYEMKPGETRENVLRYNNESVLLLDHTTRRNFFSRDLFDLELLISHYGPGPISKADIVWHVRDDSGAIHSRGSLSARDMPNGAITSLGAIKFSMPVLTDARKLTLHVRLSGEKVELENQWDFWVFPRREPVSVSAAVDAASAERLKSRFARLPSLREAPTAPLRIVSDLSDETVEFLRRGGRVVLLWQDSKPEVMHTFHPAFSGRPYGDIATVIADHPIFRRFPHDGYCNWQFYSLLHHANPPIFNGLNLAFDPLLELASSFKRVRKQALLYEYRVGEGRLLGCALSLHWDDPATVYLFDEVLSYASSDEFAPRNEAAVEDLRELIARETKDISMYKSDVALDPNARESRRAARSGKEKGTRT